MGKFQQDYNNIEKADTLIKEHRVNKRREIFHQKLFIALVIVIATIFIWMFMINYYKFN